MNQKPVDDKELEKILDDMFSYIEASTGEDIRSKTMRQLNAHFQKKYIGLLPKKWEIEGGRSGADGSIMWSKALGRNQAIDEAIANIGANHADQ